MIIDTLFKSLSTTVRYIVSGWAGIFKSPTSLHEFKLILLKISSIFLSLKISSKLKLTKFGSPKIVSFTL